MRQIETAFKNFDSSESGGPYINYLAETASKRLGNLDSFINVLLGSLFDIIKTTFLFIVFE